ncbi:MAG: glycosyltransferase family 4 protein [Micrococcus sp.]|nr:glycosyltransferase family 4 protein [Micrococcus sp.]
MTTRQEQHHRQFLPAHAPDHVQVSSLHASHRAITAAAAVCAATPWAARSVLADYGKPASHVAAVGIGAPLRPGTARRRRWNQPVFLFIGSQWERKNGPLVLEAFRTVRSAHPGAVLHLVGDQPSLSVPGVVTHGVLRRDRAEHQQRLADLFEESTCLVVPGRFEAAGIVFVEAARAGIPSICADVGGAADIVGPTGVQVVEGDIDSLVNAMTTLANGSIARDYGDLGPERAQQFTWAKVAQRILLTLETGQDSIEANLWQTPAAAYRVSEPPWAVSAEKKPTSGEDSP